MITRNPRCFIIPVREQKSRILPYNFRNFCHILCELSSYISRYHFRPPIPSTHFNPNFSLPDLVSILSSFLVLEKDGDGQGRRTLKEQGYRFSSFIVNPFCSFKNFLLPFKQCSTISFQVPVRNFCALQWVTLSHIWFKSVGCSCKRN